MEVQFFKYQGTGNDFVMIDDRIIKIGNNEEYSSTEKIKNLCDRRFGIGADGVIFLQNSDEYDFKMKYYNSDGHESSMCGNGGRCIAKFAKQLGMVGNSCVFEAIDGRHEAKIADEQVSLQMKDVNGIQARASFTVLDTGSPHLVTIIDQDLDAMDVDHAGYEIRNSVPYRQDGINVNFVEVLANDHLKVRTYERGVESETYSCGTGVTAASIALAKSSDDRQVYDIETLGGSLQVSFIKPTDDQARDIWLTGPAALVFQGVIDL